MSDQTTMQHPDESQLHPSLREHFPLRGLPRARSLVVRMDITNRCNLDCIHCTLAVDREASGEVVADMPVDVFRKISREVFPYAKLVALSCEAEPTMHKRFDDILEIVGETPGPRYMMTTNATTMTSRVVQALFECGIHGINISIDGATPATFDRIRKRARFQRVVQAIERINAMKAANNRGRDGFPRLQINYTLMRSTVQELPQMIELCREWNVHRIAVQHIYAVEQKGLQEETLVHDQELSDSILRQCEAACAVYGIRTTFPMLFRPDPQPVVGHASASNRRGERGQSGDTESDPTLFCYAPWRMLRIRWNGAVHPCDLWKGTPLGDLKTQSFEEIWGSREYVRLRWDHARRQPSHASCLSCTMVTTDNLEGKVKRTPLVLTPTAHSQRRPSAGSLFGWLGLLRR